MDIDKNHLLTINKQTAEFIRQNKDTDMHTLAFKKNKDVDMSVALEQIAGYQKAHKKLPQWHATDGILYPPPISMEQCSSERTALYKASLLGNTADSTIADLTGGFGVDFSYMARGCAKAIYVERQERLCQIARHNFKLLGLENTQIVCADSEHYIDEMPCVDIIFLDPARRNINGGRTFAISDCTPDAITLLPRLLGKSSKTIIKLSPMLDWHKAVDDFKGHVAEVHIVAVNNECKELLLILTPNITVTPKIVCRNNDDEFSYYSNNDNIAIPNSDIVSPIYNIIRCNDYLLVPNAAIMKAGCFRQLTAAFGIAPISDNSHLFISPVPIETFPGNHYRITAITSMNKKELKLTIGNIKQANIAVRNFPMSVAELRKRLKIKDGGNTFIFATTLRNGSHVLIVCS